MKSGKYWVGFILIAGLFVGLIGGCSGPSIGLDAGPSSPAEIQAQVQRNIQASISACKSDKDACTTRLDPGSKVDSVIVAEGEVSIFMNAAFAQVAFREWDILRVNQLIEKAMGRGYEAVNVQAYALGIPIEDLTPNIFRTSGIDQSRIPANPSSGRRLTTDMSRPWQTNAQLSGRHIAIWPSHGWYYEYRLDRWEWQRARLFQTVEDIFPMSFVVPYLIPMLEGAGAYAHIPRERDTQWQEVIVDNDREELNGNRFLEVGEKAYAWKPGVQPGFFPVTPLLDENPFRQGTFRKTVTSLDASAMTAWIPVIPESSSYAVYVSYGKEPNATPDARYTVYHSGGATEIRVDQTMMGGTWVYLGTFDFAEGSNPEMGRVELSNQSDEEGKVLSADAVRFGGGMGSVERGGKTSGRPRFTEGARYYMQFSGMPSNLVYNVTEGPDDYIDDYRGRAEWVNHLVGAPSGPNKDRSDAGLNVPVDISLAFHTDAGITKSDETIGTLMIYSSTGAKADKSFPSGMSRFANRDLGDIMQSTIVDDIRAKYDPNWTRRSIWDRDYSEAVRPNVPGVLLELLSHQNFADMRFGLDPRFRFDVARSVYKSMVYFLGNQYGFEPVIQPLPVSHMKAEWTSAGQIELSWKPVLDPVEDSARPTGYVVYTRENESGYGKGRLVTEPLFVFSKPTAGVVYSFKVTAVNEGGEGFAGEEVSAGRPAGAKAAGEALIISGFDRISAPAAVEFGQFRGFAHFVDEGVPDVRDLSFVGTQYDFNIDSPWADDDSPGHGASYSTYETQVLVGNTFNYPSVHGASILNAGYAFGTVSDEAVMDGSANLSPYSVVDLILGEEKKTVGPGKRVDFEAIPFSMR
ncbi:xanthan lyase, partial [bacterium]|nr:xanthan lyase [bacterium]